MRGGGGGGGDIFVTQIVIIIKSEVSAVTIVVIFSVVMYLRWSYHHIPRRLSFGPIITAQSMICANTRLHYGLKVEFLYLYITPLLSSLCRLIWRHWTYRILFSYSLSSVSTMELTLSNIFHARYGAVCVSAYPFLLWEYVYFILS